MKIINYLLLAMNVLDVKNPVLLAVIHLILVVLVEPIKNRNIY